MALANGCVSLYDLNVSGPFSCMLAAEKENKTVGVEDGHAHTRRRAIMEGHMRRNGGASTIGPAMSATELENLCSNVGKGKMFTVLAECRHSDAAGSVDKVLGKFCAPYPELTTLLGELITFIDLENAHPLNHIQISNRRY